MTMIAQALNPQVSRRQLMVGAAGLTFAVALGGSDAGRAAAPGELSPWVTIAADGTITIRSPATEMGQGTMTSIPLIFAEELDADWSKVGVAPAPPVEATFGNPGFGGMMYTAGSNAVTSYYKPVRQFGAQVRRVLLDNAAKHWGVPVDELTTEPSVVVHAKSGRRLSYAEIAAFAEVPAKAPEIGPEALKKPAQFRLIGKDVMRVELPGKVNGPAQYSIDVQLPGMLYGAVLRAPVEGSAPADFNEVTEKAIAEALSKIPGTFQVSIVKLPYGVGVLTDTPWAAFEAKDALARVTTWTKTGKAWGFDSEKGIETFATAARDLAAPGTVWDKVGDLAGEMPKAASMLEGNYRCDYAYHAQMEPLNATAAVAVGGDAVELWCGTQSQTMAVEAAAKALGISRDKVKLNDMLLGGGFGRRGHRDEEFIIDAVLLSKAAKRPVKVLWTREDDVHNGRFRPITAHHLRAGFDAAGRLVAWHHRIAGDRVTPFQDPVRYQASKGKDFILM